MMFKIMNGMIPAYLEDVLREISGDRFITLGSQRRNLALPAVTKRLPLEQFCLHWGKTLECITR